MLLALTSLTASAYDFEVGGIYYNIISDDTSVQVTYKDGNNSYSGDVNIPSTVTYSSTTYNVTEIGYRAFYYSSSLSSVIIPITITTIGSSAFQNCTSLTSVTIPNLVTTIGDNAFADCTGLKSAMIGENVTSLGSAAFGRCYALTSVVIGKSVASLGENAFFGCEKLTEIISLAESAPGVVGTNCFTSVPKSTCKVIVPSDALSKYSGWGGFSTITDRHTVNKFGKDMATLWLSYPVKIPDGIEAYTAALSAEKDKVMLTKIDGTIIPAETGVILKKTGSEDSYDFVIAPNSYNETTSNENQLIGYPADLTLSGSETDYYYKLTYKTSVDTDFGFYRTQSTEKLIANKAYLKLDKSFFGAASAPSRSIGIDWGEDDTTEIESIVECDTDGGTMYNLQGTPVGNDYKGIVIKGGRKILMK